jgi:transcriptional regulator with XRE-family HTH domain
VPDAADVDALLRSLGQSVRDRRTTLGFTITELAAVSGLSRPFISQVERGLARPSMRSLTSLATALGTTAHMLMTLPEDAQVGLVRREAPDNLRVTHGDGLARGLVRGSRAMLPVEFRSGPREFEEYYLHSGEEFMYVFQGRFEMDIEDSGIYELAEGDTLYYAGGLRHRWRVVSEGPICMLLVQHSPSSRG